MHRENVNAILNIQITQNSVAEPVEEKKPSFSWKKKPFENDLLTIKSQSMINSIAEKNMILLSIIGKTANFDRSETWILTSASNESKTFLFIMLLLFFTKATFYWIDSSRCWMPQCVSVFVSIFFSLALKYEKKKDLCAMHSKQAHLAIT